MGPTSSNACDGSAPNADANDWYILSVISSRPAMHARHGEAIREVEAWLAKEQVPLLTSQRTPVLAVGEVKIAPGRLNDLLTSLKEHQGQWLESFGCDVNICPNGLRHAIHQGQRTLFIFDMDSTLIQIECIDEIAREAGVAEQVSRITAEAMAGGWEFRESLQARLALLRGIKVDWEGLKRKIPFTKGIFRLAGVLREQNVRTVVVSGGFMPVAEYVREKLEFDRCYANQLQVDEEGRLTGALLGDECLDANRKRELMLECAREWNIEEGHIVAVGDGANDQLMCRGANPYGCAFNAKPILAQSVRKQWTVSLFAANEISS